MQLNQATKRKFDDYTATGYPQGAVLDHNAQGLLTMSSSAHHPHMAGPVLGHPSHNPGLMQYQHHQLQHQQPLPHHPLHPMSHHTLQAHNNYQPAVNDGLGASTSPPQLPVAGKEKKPRKKREKAEKTEKPRKSRKSKSKEEEEAKPKVLFRGSRFELWLETRFEEELLKHFAVPALEFSANLVANGGSSSTSPGGASWEMTRSDEERIYKEKWRKRYHVYTANVSDLVANSFNFHVRIKNASGEYNKLPFITPDKIMASPLTSYSNYLSLLGGAHINPGEDHCGYPPGEAIGEDACTLYEGSDVSFVLVGQLVGPSATGPPPQAGPVPAASSSSLPAHYQQHHQQHQPQHQQHQQHQPQHRAAPLHHPAGVGYPLHLQFPTDGNHP